MRSHLLDRVLRAVLGTSADTDQSQSQLEWPPDLITTDRILQRWAVSVGSGLPEEAWDDRPVAKPPPLDEESAMIVDRLIMHAPHRIQLGIKLWYRTPQPRAVIARRLNVTRDGLRLEMCAALTYMQKQLKTKGNSALLTLLELDIWTASRAT